MKKKASLILTLLISYSFLYAVDTTKVQVHDNVDITWYGSYDKWGYFPQSNQSWRKVLLHYTMGCASGGCSDWDYTTNIEIKHRTGEIDSNLVLAPSMIVNGNIQDSISGSTGPTETTFFDTVSQTTQFMANDPIELVFYNNPLDPWQATDTAYIWPSDYEQYFYNNSGDIIDTIIWTSDTTIYTSYIETYDVYEIIENYEIARVITPYGGYMASGTQGFNNNWEHTFTFDITDYASLLQDSVEIRAFYSGWSSGFSVTLDFDFIEGVPPRNVLEIENIYNGSWSYVSSSDFESNYLTPKKTLISSNSDGAMFRFIPSGHGFDNNMYAAEFTNKNYYVNINGSQVDFQAMWRDDCGLNPIFPQGGTWLLDRANWCPGSEAWAHDHEITPYINPGDSIEIDVNIQAYSWSGTQTPSYIIDGQLFQYSAPNFNLDAEVVEIISPSLKDPYSRMNPVCGEIKLKIKNSGATPLTSAKIKYRVQGTTWNTFNWTGNLNFLEEEILTLSMEGSDNWLSWWGEPNTFEAQIEEPNGGIDENPDNNWSFSEFEVVPSYPEEFEIWFRTNTAYWETSCEILDMQDNVLWEKSHSNNTLEANIIYKDTITLSEGCYKMIIKDTGKDGLNYWANSDGSGYVKFKEPGGNWLKEFEEDFGTEITHYFTIGYNLSNNNIIEEFNLYPNPNKGTLIVEPLFDVNETVSFILRNQLGKIMFKKELVFDGSQKEEVLLPSLPNGIYISTFKTEANSFSSKLVLIK